MTKRGVPSELMALEKNLARLAKEGSVREFAQALLEHPVDGRLLRTWAAEDNAPEHARFMERVMLELAAQGMGDR